MKKLFLLLWLFGYNSLVVASPISFSVKTVKVVREEITISIENNTSKRMVFPSFKRNVNPLILIVYQDGNLIKDENAIKVKPRPPNCAYFKDRVISREPNEKDSFGVIIYHGPHNFRFIWEGTYYLVSYLKKGDNWIDGLISSNLLSFEWKNGRITESREITREALPTKIQSVFNEELKKIEAEETSNF